jgi:hypothetical protein
MQQLPFGTAQQVCQSEPGVAHLAEAGWTGERKKAMQINHL